MCNIYVLTLVSFIIPLETYAFMNDDRFSCSERKLCYRFIYEPVTLAALKCEQMTESKDTKFYSTKKSCSILFRSRFNHTSTIDMCILLFLFSFSFHFFCQSFHFFNAVDIKIHTSTPPNETKMDWPENCSFIQNCIKRKPLFILIIKRAKENEREREWSIPEQ